MSCFATHTLSPVRRPRPGSLSVSTHTHMDMTHQLTPRTTHGRAGRHAGASVSPSALRSTATTELHSRSAMASWHSHPIGPRLSCVAYPTGETYRHLHRLHVHVCRRQRCQPPPSSVVTRSLTVRMLQCAMSLLHLAPRTSPGAAGQRAPHPRRGSCVLRMIILPSHSCISSSPLSMPLVSISRPLTLSSSQSDASACTTSSGLPSHKSHEPRASSPCS